METYSSYQSGATAAGAADARFKSLIHTIGSNIQKISQNVLSMSKIVNQLQTPQDSQELRNQLRQIQHYTQQLAKDTSTLLVELMKMPIPPDQLAAKLTKSRLSDEYMTTLNEFQNVQKQAAQKTKEEVRKSKAQSFNINEAFNQGRPNSGSNYPDNSLVELETPPPHRQEQATIQSERELQEMEQRERDMYQIENDIVAVNDIFKELGKIIHDQGSVVDSIEASIEHTASNVEGGTVQLREAGNYQNKARRKKVYLTLALIIVIVVILIIIFAR